MNRLKEYIGYVASLLMLCVWLVTILLYGEKINSNTTTDEKILIELEEIHTYVEGQTNWNTRVGTIIEIQTGIPINLDP